MAGPAKAAEWSILPSVGAKGVYNDNLLLTPLPHDATYGYWVSPAAEFAGKTERLEVKGRAAADFVTYYGGEETQFTNLFFPLNVQYATESDTLGFSGGFTRDNTLMGELLTTGVVLRFTQRNLWSATPTYARQLTERLSLQTSLQFSDATYENGLRLGLVDYQLYGGSAGLQYQLSEQDRVQLSGSYTNFHTTNSPSPFRAHFPGANLDLTHSFTESLAVNLYGGPRYVSSTTSIGGNALETNKTVWVYGAGLTKQFEHGTLLVQAMRDIYPSGFGLLIQTDRAGFTGTYNVSETFTVGLDTYGYLTSGVTSTALGRPFSDQQYFTVGPKVGWKFREWWKVEVSYTYRWRDADNSPQATSNGAMFMLTYFPPKLAMSN
ncbi:hypothetical protein [Petrachloros mirabilis]